MGEEKKEEGSKEEKKDENKEENVEIVLKVDMHCEACARKVAKSLKGFEGVEEVTADSRASKVVVKGKAADPIKVCERLQKKSGKKVELISPLPKPPEQKKEENKEPPKEEKKDESGVFESTVSGADMKVTKQAKAHVTRGTAVTIEKYVHLVLPCPTLMTFTDDRLVILVPHK
ncbi:Heavy metal-associated domain, HMA [Sesbania bispinosa]|nr:Heavy metal-associated domain, HMA [Sesbania bispinosa]